MFAPIIPQRDETAAPPPFVILDGATAAVSDASPVGTRIATCALSSEAPGTWSLGAGSWAKASLSGATATSVNVVLNAAVVAGDAGAKVVTVKHSSAPTGLDIVVSVTYTGSTAESPRYKQGYDGAWLGNLCQNINNTNAKWTTKARRGHGARHQVSLPLKAGIIQIASCQSGSEHNGGSKCASEGPFTFDWYVFDGSGPATSVLPATPGVLKASGSKTVDRGTTGANGDQRRMVRFDWTAFNVKRGDYSFLLCKSRSNNPSTDYVSINGPCLRSGRTRSNLVPMGLSHQQRQGPFGGDHETLWVIESGENTGVWQRGTEFLPHVTWVYQDGAAELKIGRGYWENCPDDMDPSLGNRTAGQITVGGNYRLRHVWRQRETRSVGEIWTNAYWFNGFKPSSPLVCTLSEASGWAQAQSMQPTAAASGYDTDNTTINSWKRNYDGYYYLFTRSVLPTVRQLVAGRVYTMEYTSTDGSNFYYIPATRPVAVGMNYDDTPAQTGLWYEDPANSSKPSFSERSTNGGGSWSKFTFWGAAQDQAAILAGLRYAD